MPVDGDREVKGKKRRTLLRGVVVGTAAASRLCPALEERGAETRRDDFTYGGTAYSDGGPAYLWRGEGGEGRRISGRRLFKRGNRRRLSAAAWAGRRIFLEGERKKGDATGLESFHVGLTEWLRSKGLLSSQSIAGKKREREKGDGCSTRGPRP